MDARLTCTWIITPCILIIMNAIWLIITVGVYDVLECIDSEQTYGPRREKTCLRRFANNTGADQPAHPRSLISALVIRYLESIICKLATGEISIFQLFSAAEETGFNLALLETPKTDFLATKPIFKTSNTTVFTCV